MVKKGRKFERERGEKEKEKEKTPVLKPEARHGIWVVVLFTLAILGFLSLFDLAGGLGRVLADILKNLFGWGKFIFPFLLLIIGYFLLRPEQYRLKSTNYLGLIFFTLSYSGLLHLFIKLDLALEKIPEGVGGGYAGLVLSYPFQKIMGFWATLVVLIAILIIYLLVMFNTSLQNIAEKRGLFNYLFSKISARFSRPPKESDVYDSASFTRRDIAKEVEEKEEEREDRKSALAGEKKGQTAIPMAEKPKKVRREVHISLDLLDSNSSKPRSGDIELNKMKIKKTLENFGIAVEMGDVNVGPTVTQFTLKPTEGVKLSQITSLQNDIALALAAHPIRMEAPIPGKSLVGIEVPNQTVALVNLKEVLSSDSFKNRRSNLSFALGKDVSGRPLAADLDPMPHLLIAGATGSGKSVCVNNIIMSMMFANSPDDLKFILVDPKRVELTVYNNNPYLLSPVITEVKQTINALRWLVSEMDRRFQTLSKTGKRDIHVYHREVEDGMPYIILIIDELADLMSVASVEVESAIIRLAQMARAVGIHLVLATQRPSVNVITGLIKANITARIAFNVASSVDSRTILDTSGAEKLLGKGDMLFINSELSKPKRLQGSYVSDKEIERVVNFVRGQVKTEYNEEITEKSQEPPLGSSMDDLGDDELLSQSKEVILRAGKASASLLQRRLRIGYARAARILDLLESQGFIGPADGAKPREVFSRRPGQETGPDEESESEEIIGGERSEDESEEEKDGI
ncbi:MAG: DNA translocase FtsK 4TM domain-containing protein [Patescibacteria group bacterium]